MKYILAGNHRQFLNYLSEKKLAPIEAIYIWQPSQLVGRVIDIKKGDEIIKVGSWYENPNSDAILARLAIATRSNS